MCSDFFGISCEQTLCHHDQRVTLVCAALVLQGLFASYISLVYLYNGECQ